MAKVNKYLGPYTEAGIRVRFRSFLLMFVINRKNPGRFRLLVPPAVRCTGAQTVLFI